MIFKRTNKDSISSFSFFLDNAELSGSIPFPSPFHLQYLLTMAAFLAWQIVQKVVVAVGAGLVISYLSDKVHKEVQKVVVNRKVDTNTYEVSFSLFNLFNTIYHSLLNI